MKKLNILLVVAILVSALIAQALPAKLVRLEVYNWTGADIMIRLEGRITGAFYYLTVPPITIKNAYAPKVYTIVTDTYKRTTWACGGVQTTGSFIVRKNVRLNFPGCDKLPLRMVWWDFSGNQLVEGDELFKAPNFGEPTMEKVVYFNAVSNKVWVKIPLWVLPAPQNTNLWFMTPGSTGVLLAPVIRQGVPFVMQEYCSPNNCFYRLAWQPVAWNALGVATAWIPSGFFYGPGPYNRFRYRY